MGVMDSPLYSVQFNYVHKWKLQVSWTFRISNYLSYDTNLSSWVVLSANYYIRDNRDSQRFAYLGIVLTVTNIQKHFLQLDACDLNDLSVSKLIIGKSINANYGWREADPATFSSGINSYNVLWDGFAIKINAIGTLRAMSSGNFYKQRRI